MKWFFYRVAQMFEKPCSIVLYPIIPTKVGVIVSMGKVGLLTLGNTICGICKDLLTYWTIHTAAISSFLTCILG